MAEIKKNVQTLGQRITGLTAGNQYVFVLTRPALRPDLENARRAARLCEHHLAESKRAIAALAQAREEAIRGDVAAARKFFEEAQALFAAVDATLGDAHDFATRAAEDAKDIAADVKDAYDAARDCAEQAVATAKKIAESAPQAVRSIGALIAETAARI
jgi:hypothetical protein